MIFKSKQVNTDQKPYRDGMTGRRFASIAQADAEIHDISELEFDHRPEFNVTRDPEPYRNEDSAERLTAQEAEQDRATGWEVTFDPRPEYDHPVNRVLVAFRQGRFASLDWFLHEYCHDTDSWVWDGTDAENPTPEEIDHARRVLTRLAGWSA